MHTHGLHGSIRQPVIFLAAQEAGANGTVAQCSTPLMSLIDHVITPNV
jgi:hypothetical protein